MDLRKLVGSGDRIGLLMLPFVVVGLVLNFVWPSIFSVGGPSPVLTLVSVIILAIGVINWLWCVVLILTKVPRGELITSGPFNWVKHPLYEGVALLVLPWLGFLLNSWLGAALGLVLYLGSRRYGPDEEAELHRVFGQAWESYLHEVKLPWL
jgi:protein-S-isoprenylcysteine O-methyltransferase Ste14